MENLEGRVEEMRLHLAAKSREESMSGRSRIESAGNIKSALEVLQAIHSYFVEFGCALHPSAPLRENDPRSAAQCIHEAIVLLENEHFQLLSGPRS
jgi:hypothetical protein